MYFQIMLVCKIASSHGIQIEEGEVSLIKYGKYSNYLWKTLGDEGCEKAEGLSMNLDTVRRVNAYLNWEKLKCSDS